MDQIAVVLGIIVMIALWLAIASIPATIASRKGHDSGLWFFFGLFFFLPALVCAILVSDKTDGGGRSRRPCPHCAELILPAARICRYCGLDVAPVALHAGR